VAQGIGDSLRRVLGALMEAVRVNGRRSAIVALLLLGQFALAHHQHHHRLSPDLSAPSGDCALGHLASHLATGADAMVVLPPDRVGGRPAFVPADAAPASHAVASYRSRAPPTVLSI
jgi:hypothetical protein